jgi:hypothetical protein
MSILEVTLAATSTWDLTFGLPEPVAMALWGAGLLLLSVSLRRARESAPSPAESRPVGVPARLLPRPLA